MRGPKGGATIGWNYIHSLHILNLSQGFAPLVRLMDMCWEQGLPDDMRTYYRAVAADLGYRDYSLMRRYMLMLVNRSHKLAPAYIERAMGEKYGGEKSDPYLRSIHDLDFFVCEAAMEMLRFRDEYAEMKRSKKTE